MVTQSISGGGSGSGSSSMHWSFESVVRRSVVIESFLRDRTPKPAAVPEQEAEIHCGKPSSFQWSVSNPPPTGGGGVTRNPPPPNPDDEDEEEPTPGEKTIVFEETARTVSDIRVENPTDSEQWVEVERIEDLTVDIPSDLLDSLVQLRDGTIAKLFGKIVLHHPTSS